MICRFEALTEASHKRVRSVSVAGVAGTLPRSRIVNASPVDLLVAAHRGGPLIHSNDLQVSDTHAAYALQDAVLASIGPVGGWKVGAKSANAEPTCAPLPASGLVGSPAMFRLAPEALRGIELEVALRVRRDLDVNPQVIPSMTLDDMFDAVFPAIELVGTRLASFDTADPLAKLADLASHSALVIGPAAAMTPGQTSLPEIRTTLTFDGQTVAQTVGGNPAVDLLRLAHWLAGHCIRRGTPLRGGQIVTTGSCTGMLFAQAQSQIAGVIESIGEVKLQLNT